jgi:hypothetical protein
VTDVQAGFTESGAEPVTRAVPLSHVSVELGHLYPEDWAGGRRSLATALEDAVPWARAAKDAVRVTGHRPRVSTCFLVDDYFGDLPGPDQLVPDLLSVATELGITIDYLAREAACAEADGPGGRVSPATLLVAQLVEEPPPPGTGERPAAVESGWLCNGARSPSQQSRQALDTPPAWAPPRQSAARRHSIFVDVQLWDDVNGVRTWSCPLLAATWQSLRLGLLRDRGVAPVSPEPAPSRWPDNWSRIPPVVRLQDRADPFSAYTTLSVLSPRFLPVELAVRTILGQVQQDPAVTKQIRARADGEEFALPLEVLDRIHYAFTTFSEVDPA